MSEAKDIPVHALERLRGLRREGHPGGIFTSDFSGNEFLLVRKAGLEPIGLCIGSCIYHLGIQHGSWNRNQELSVLSQAMYEARELAMTRMREEATGMGADGIVGVELTVKRLEWDAHILEFMAIGTGVGHAKGHPGFKGPNGQPFTSDLSGQDFWTLLHAGYRPLEMVMGSCVYHVAHQSMSGRSRQRGRSRQKPRTTRAWHCRRAARTSQRRRWRTSTRRSKRSRHCRLPMRPFCRRRRS
jgi:uncharacterized protein YbjQ (UPF0145 family)